MALPAAGNPIDFGQIQTEFGGSHPIAMNEYSDRLGLGYVLNYTGSHNIGMFYGLSNISIGSWPTATGFYETMAFKSDVNEAFLRLEFQISGSNVVLRWTKGGSSAVASPVTQNVAFSGENPQVKVVWSITTQSGTRSSPSGVSSNVYYSIPTSGYRTYLWKAGFAMSGTNNITGTYTAYLNNSAGTINSGSKSFSLSTTAGGGGPK